jgi:hypothetical protein
MSDAQQPCPPDHPLMVAWEKYKAAPEFANTKQWAQNLNYICKNPDSVDGNLWAAFVQGWQAAGGAMP